MWTIDDNDSSFLSEVALTPSRIIVDERRMNDYYQINLMLPPNIFQGGLDYLVKLTFYPLEGNQSVGDVTFADSTIYSSIEVVPNRLPLPGVFTVSPSMGYSLQDDFYFLSKLWSSSHMPLLLSLIHI